MSFWEVRVRVQRLKTAINEQDRHFHRISIVFSINMKGSTGHRVNNDELLVKCEAVAQKKHNIPFHLCSKEIQASIQDEIERPPPNLGFEIDLTYIPTNEQPIISLKGRKVLSVGNLMGIVSKSGTGKSQLCEAIASKWVDAEADAFGFDVQHPDNKYDALYIDTERSRNDSHRGYMRIAKRINDNYVMGNNIHNLKYISFKCIPTVDERKKAVECLLNTDSIGLLIIDGITDLMLSVNDEDKSIELLNWLTALADTKDLAVLMTIHSSPSSVEDKPRGHIGSEIYRRAESMWKLTSDGDVKILHTDFGFGKVRNDYNLLETYFTWDDDKKMFVSCDYTPETKTKKINYDHIFSEAFGTAMLLTHSELCNKIVEVDGVSLPTAKRRIRDGAEMQKIIKDDYGNYRRVSA